MDERGKGKEISVRKSESAESKPDRTGKSLFGRALDDGRTRRGEKARTRAVVLDPFG